MEEKKYLDFLRAWLKNQDYVALAYMTGILPVKKYGSHSVLNMFTEYSMLNPCDMAEFFGFTEDEVKSLYSQYDRNLWSPENLYFHECWWSERRSGAIAQIKEKQYVDALKDYHGNLLLAGINYDKDTKKIVNDSKGGMVCIII